MASGGLVSVPAMANESEWLFDGAATPVTPSTLQGYSWSQEHRLRESTAHLIVDLAQRLHMPRATGVTALVYMNRFFCVHAFQDHDRYLVGAACVYVASKTTECAMKLTDFTERTLMLVDDCRDKKSMPAASEVEHVKAKIRQYEVIILNTLSYELVVANPYHLVMLKLELVQAILNMPYEEVRDVAWLFATDAVKSIVGVQHTMEEIAAGAVYLSYLFHRIPRDTTACDSDRPWWTVLGLSGSDLDFVSKSLLGLYQHRRKRSPAALQRLFDEYPTAYRSTR
ncbi:hypothetical protein ACHHYP_00274 [Achlya hypogyna]|uniref:Cyclin-like domain-containing protein n=1 Tax=Achlya hypogyna TaxID=1202772 RepID=A0A1V9ZUP0_ACHHY|nr:hypothetical protein ACHHYP_00274 [Achlya hypogyna]